MGIRRADGGYSANVEGFLVIRGERVRIAKTNCTAFSLAEPCELAPGTTATLLVIVDGKEDTKLVELPQGVSSGQTIVNYKVLAPF
jgi:hypothetical protein